LFHVSINGKEYTAYENETLLSIARREGIFIPSLCFDPRVEVSGACGLCLAEIADPSGTFAQKPVRACATVAVPGMVIRTDTPRVRQAQKRIIELLLSAHDGDCVAPCRLACPAGTDCQAYIALIAEGKYEEAVNLMYKAHPFPASVARICPRFCEKNCRRAEKGEAVNIAGLKRYAVQQAGKELSPVGLNFTAHPSKGDHSGNAPDAQSVNVLDDSFPIGVNFTVHPSPESPVKRFAIIGGGPAGLTAAYFLRRAGHHVVVYDRAQKMGGLLRYGIPEYRLPKKVLDAELAVLERMGIIFNNDGWLGYTSNPESNNHHNALCVETLCAENDAVIIATGAWNPKPLGCPGDDLPGVYGGTAFLLLVAMGYISKERMPNLNRVVVVGGSNTAIDAARTALRIGAKEVVISYRRTRTEMPAEPREIAEAEAEGVVFKYLTAPIEITAKEVPSEDIPDPAPLISASGIRLQRMSLGEPDESGRRAPVPFSGAEEWLEADMIISAIGQAVEPEISNLNLPNVHIIGDATGQTSYAIEAIAQGKKAAAVILAAFETPPFTLTSQRLTPHSDLPPTPRQTAQALPSAQAKKGWDEIHPDLSPAQAAKESARCLSCGCAGYHKCKLISLTNRLGADPHKYRAKSDSPKLSLPSHDPDKCVLCGLCVRACEKRNGAGQGLLSASHRGIRTVLHTAQLGSPACEGCTDCADICPTGAMKPQCIAPLPPNC